MSYTAVQQRKFALDNLDIARKELAAAALNVQTRWDRLPPLANAVAKAQGKYDTWSEIVNVLNDGATIAVFPQILLNIATYAPDDTWGGRTGDAQRSYNEGRREAIVWITQQPHLDAWVAAQRVTA